MKKVSNNEYAKYLFSVYAKYKHNLLFKDGDVYRVYTGGDKAHVKKIATLYQHP